MSNKRKPERGRQRERGRKSRETDRERVRKSRETAGLKG